MNADESNQFRNEKTSLEISKDSFALTSKELGRGNFGTVVLATLKPGTGWSETAAVSAAAKGLRVNNAKTKSTVVASWLDRETRVWSSCNHENILKFIGYYTENDFTTVYLFSPYMLNGNALTYLEKRQSTMEERFLLVKDTLMGLDYLHSLSPPVVHGNLKAANVLISDDGRAVLSDIGLYTLINRVQLIAGSSLESMVGRSGPESVSTSDRTTKSDIWGWGCLALEMMTGKIPYHYLDWVHQVKERVLSGQTPEPRPPPQNWPTGLLELVRRCWTFSPEDRPNVRMCVESVNMTVSLVEGLRKEVLGVLGSSFIAEERLQPEPNQTLGEAGNRMTRIVKLSPSGALVVVKEINLRQVPSISSRLELFNRFTRQAAVLSSLKHENILEFIGYSARGYFETVGLVTANAVNGNLADYMNKEVDMSGKLGLARDTMNGLRYLHSSEPTVVHGNITPFNVLINDTGRAMLSDVGLAAIDWHPMATSPRASGRWSSPEVNIEESAVVQSDIWSWACVVLQLVTGDPPYSYIQNEDQVKAVMSTRRRDRITPEAFHELDDVPDMLVRLLRRCWDFSLLQRPNAEECMDILNSMLNTDSDAHSGTEEQTERLSPADEISRLITSVSPQAICINGRFGDVFKGIHRTKGEVALKRLRIGGAGIDGEITRRFEREADTWRRLKHPHVLEFLGTYKPEAHLYFVSPFAKNGTLLEYVSDRPGINRVRLLCETSDAIDYLHRESVVHGDIKASNLLISDDGDVLLCNFGLAKSTYAQTSTALKGAGTFRWQSPELWDNEPRTFASDVYAFSMTIVEVLTGLPPFSHLENEVAVVMAVYRGERPAKIPLESNGVSYDTAWKVAEACWTRIPGDRMSISDAFRLLSADPSLT